MTRSVARDHRDVRPVAVAHVLDERQNDGDDDAILDAEPDDGRCGGEGEGELPGAVRPDFAEPSHVDQPDSDEEHDGRKDRRGQQAQRSREQEKDDEDHDRRRQMRPLAAASCGIDDGGLRRTANDHERAAASCSKVRRREAIKSRFSSNRSPYRKAYARHVAALYAMTTKHENAIGTLIMTSARLGRGIPR